MYKKSIIIQGGDSKESFNLSMHTGEVTAGNKPHYSETMSLFKLYIFANTKFFNGKGEKKWY